MSIEELLAEAGSRRMGNHQFVLTQREDGEWSATFAGAVVPANFGGPCATPAEAVAAALESLRAAGEACGAGTLGYAEAGLPEGARKAPRKKLRLEIELCDEANTGEDLAFELREAAEMVATDCNGDLRQWPHSQGADIEARRIGGKIGEWRIA